MGPMQGVHPKPKASPIKYGKKIFLDFFASNLFSKFKYVIFITPIKWSEKITIMIPANDLSICEFCKNNFPNHLRNVLKIKDY